MKKLMIFLIALIPIALILTVQVSTTLVAETQYVAVEAVSFENSTMEIIKETEKDVVIFFPAKITPLGATYKDVIYKSSNTDIATVTADGTIVFKDFGAVTITAQSKDNISLTAECKFYVTDNKAHRVEILNKIETLVVGESHYLESLITPNEALDKNLTYSSSNEDVAQVMPDGKIIAVNGGTSTITVSTVNNHTDSFDLQVIVPVTGINIYETTLITGVATTTFPSYNIMPANATNKNVTYTTNNPDIADIDENGNITFKTKGEATFIVSTIDGEFTAEYKVTYTAGYILSAEIEQGYNSIQLEYSEYKDGKLINIPVNIFPADANTNNIIFNSQNTSVVNVINNGTQLVVTGGRTAIIDVFVKSSENETIKIGSCEIYVVRPVESITLTESALEINSKEYQIEYSIIPANDYTDEISFKINSNVATVNQNGYVTFTNPGSAVVTVVANNNVQETTTITYVPAGAKVVNITNVSENIELNYLDESFALFFDNALDMKNTTYSVSDSSVLTYDEQSQSFIINKGGEVKITASSTTGGSVNIDVVVIRKANELTYSVANHVIENSKITTSKDNLTITSTVLPEDATDKTITYSVNNSTIANITNAGVLTFIKAGTVNVTIKANGADNLVKTLIVESTFGLPSTFTLTETNITLEDINETFTLNNTHFTSFKPEDYTFEMADFTFASQNNNCVTVSSNGLITAIGKGTTKISVSIIGGETKYINVEVRIKTTAVDMAYKGDVLDGSVTIIGKTLQLETIVYPEIANNKTVTWEIVEGANFALIDENGLVTILNGVNTATIKVKVTTNDAGKFDNLTIFKTDSPTTLEIYKGANKVTGGQINVLATENADPILNVVLLSDNLLDPENLTFADLQITNQDETGLVTTISDKSNGYYSVSHTNTVKKSLGTAITFTYGTISKNINIKFYKITKIDLMLNASILYEDPTTVVTLNNDDDKNYGMERKRVWGTMSYYNNRDNYDLPIISRPNDEAADETLYWFTDDSEIIRPSFADGKIYFINQAIDVETQVPFYVSNNPNFNINNAPEAWEVRAQYIFTLVPRDINKYDGSYKNSLNIFTSTGYKNSVNYSRALPIVLHVNLGSNADASELVGKPFSLFDPTISTQGAYTLLYSMVYGNGHTINYNGCSTIFRGTISIRNGLRNLTMKLQDFDQSKGSYENYIGSNGASFTYVTIKNGMEGVYAGQDTGVLVPDPVTEFKNCILKHFTSGGIVLGKESEGIEVVVEDTIIYDSGQAGIHYRNGTIKIKGFFDVINFRTPSEFEGLGYSSVIENAISSSEFNSYVYKPAGASASGYLTNLTIVATPKNIFGKPSVNSVYFWNGTEYVANNDTCTGLNYTYKSCSRIGITIYVWLTPLSTVPYNTTPDESKVYRQI